METFSGACAVIVCVSKLIQMTVELIEKDDTHGQRIGSLIVGTIALLGTLHLFGVFSR